MAAVWIEATRPATLVVGVVPVLVGTASSDTFIAWRFVAALAVALSIQVAANFANDYFDAVKAVDTSARVGPRRLTASGLIAPGHMRTATVLMFVLAAVPLTALVAAVGLELVPFAVVACIAAVLYSGGPKPISAQGLGEVLDFLFFGLLATGGAAYVQIERITLLALVASIPLGSLAASILLINNLRDVDTDRVAGKRTLPVRIGRRRGRIVYSGLIVAAYVSLLAIALISHRIWALLPLISIPFAVRAIALARSAEDGRAFLDALRATTRLDLAFGLLLAIGIW